MKYFIITGASKGLGKAIIDQLILDSNNTVFGISRSSNEEHLSKGAKYFNVDLGKPNEVIGTITKVLNSIVKAEGDEFYLINNAGVINPIKTIENTDMNDLITNINVNLTSLMILTSEFIKSLEKINGKKRIINISSGAAKRPVYGWNVYCSTKAGVDIFTQTVALEQNAKEFPVHLVSLAPGIMDTEMQEKIRSADKEDFRDLKEFVGFKEKGKLVQAEAVAVGVLRLLLGDEFINGDVTRVESYL